jgi:uncharacterized membrane protein YoaK (UPF0700 family)
MGHYYGFDVISFQSDNKSLMTVRKIDFTQDNSTNIFLWIIFAFQAGAINTGGLMTFHRFVSHMTGFASHFGLELANNHIPAALSMASVPIFFLVGAGLSAILIDHPIYEDKDPKYLHAAILISYFLFIATLGGTLGYFGEFGQPKFDFSNYVLIAMLAMTTGLQNALLISKNGSPIRTTHLTGLTTDLGIGIARIFLRKQPQYQTSYEIHQNFIRAGTIISFILGSGISAFLFLNFNFLGYLLPLLTSFVFVYYCIAVRYNFFPFSKKVTT